MAYETFRGEHNTSLIFDIHDEVVNYVNDSFKDLVKNITHSYEYTISHANIFQLMDARICMHTHTDKRVDIDLTFIKKFTKSGLAINYKLKDNKDKELPPIACATIDCQMKEEEVNDYIFNLF